MTRRELFLAPLAVLVAASAKSSAKPGGMPILLPPQVQIIGHFDESAFRNHLAEALERVGFEEAKWQPLA